MKPSDAAIKKGVVERDSNGHLVLKKECSWYYQIQMEMLATDLDAGILVIYTDLGIELVSVPYDLEYAHMIQTKLVSFYTKYVVSHLVAQC